jgi:hypothetical protein
MSILRARPYHSLHWSQLNVILASGDAAPIRATS